MKPAKTAFAFEHFPGGFIEAYLTVYMNGLEVQYKTFSRHGLLYLPKSRLVSCPKFIWKATERRRNWMSIHFGPGDENLMERETYGTKSPINVNLFSFAVF